MARPNAVEQHGSVKDDGIDASELLEHHEHEGDDQLGTVLGLEQVSHGVGRQVRNASRLCHVLELFLDVRGPSNARQYLSAKPSRVQQESLKC